MRFFQPVFRLAHCAQRSREAYFAENHRICGQAGVFARRQQGGGDGEIGGGFGNLHAAGNVEINIEPGKGDAATGFEYCKDHGEAAAIPADHGSTWLRMW